MHGTASSVLSGTSLVIRRPLFGCQCCGTMLAVAYKTTKDEKRKEITQGNFSTYIMCTEQAHEPSYVN